jgi:hypothetical protein
VIGQTALPAGVIQFSIHRGTSDRATSLIPSGILTFAPHRHFPATSCTSRHKAEGSSVL